MHLLRGGGGASKVPAEVALELREDDRESCTTVTKRVSECDSCGSSTAAQVQRGSRGNALAENAKEIDNPHTAGSRLGQTRKGWGNWSFFGGDETGDDVDCGGLAATCAWGGKRGRARGYKAGGSVEEVAVDPVDEATVTDVGVIKQHLRRAPDWAAAINNIAFM
eukprot:4266806-Pleurochrysis_carterae.AAC.1